MDASQYFGFLAFLFVFTAGFWLLIFLLTFVVPYWIGGTGNGKLSIEKRSEGQKIIAFQKVKKGTVKYCSPFFYDSF